MAGQLPIANSGRAERMTLLPGRAADLSYWRALTLTALALMNASWAAALFRTLVPGEVQQSSLLIVVYFTLLPLASIGAIAVVRGLRLSASVERVAGLAVLLLGVLLAFPFLIYPGAQAGLGRLLIRYFSAFTNLALLLRPEPIITVLIVIFWRRGIALARHWVGPLVVQRDFRIGMLVLFAIGLAATGLERRVPYVEVFVFLFAALMSMGAARLASLSHIRGGRSIPFDRQWFIAIASGAAGLIAVTGLLAYLGAGPLAAGLGRLISAAASAAAAALLFVLRPLIVLVTDLFNRLLARLLPLLTQAEPDLQVLPSLEEVSQMMEGLSEEITPVPFAGGLLDVVKFGLIALGIGVVLLVVYFSLRNTRAGRLWLNMEERERERILGSIPDYLRSLLRRAGRTTEMLERLNPAAQVLAAARIRQIYRRLLRLSARLGVVRGEAETPLELLADLPRVFPGAGEDLDDITRAYLRVRYGEYPESRQEVQRVENAWREIRKRAQPLPDEA